ncbi:MAG: DUF5683 domain-containing protein [Bacteroidales bacterium]|nr:DUF5683 domain-containing protein [Bacteroidales bacterium]
MVSKKIRWVFLLVMIWISLPSQLMAQIDEEPDLDDPAVKHGYREGRNDTTRARIATDGDNYVYLDDAEFLNDTVVPPTTKNPKLAGWMSFVVPGAGQVYNGQYWKVPIIYGAIGTIYYVSEFYNIRYKQLMNDESYILSVQAGHPEGHSFFDLPNEQDIVKYMLRYRRYRDLCYAGLFLVYMMNIFDAVVDAHLYDYDVTDNMALRVEPYAAPTFMVENRPTFGARIVLTF